MTHVSYDLLMWNHSIATQRDNQTSNIWISRSSSSPGFSFEWREQWIFLAVVIISSPISFICDDSCMLWFICGDSCMLDTSFLMISCEIIAYRVASHTGWRRRPIYGCLKLQVNSATDINYRVLLQKMTIRKRHPVGLRHPVARTSSYSYMCHMNHFLQRDSLMCMLWFMFKMRYHILMCDVRHFLWYNSFMCVPWLICCDMTRSCVYHDWCMTWLMTTHEWVISREMTHSTHIREFCHRKWCMTWLMHMCVCVCVVHMCAMSLQMTHSRVCYYSFSVTWPTHMYAMVDVWHDSYI